MHSKENIQFRKKEKLISSNLALVYWEEKTLQVGKCLSLPFFEMLITYKLTYTAFINPWIFKTILQILRLIYLKKTILIRPSFSSWNDFHLIYPKVPNIVFVLELKPPPFAPPRETFQKWPRDGATFWLCLLPYLTLAKLGVNNNMLKYLYRL